MSKMTLNIAEIAEVLNTDKNSVMFYANRERDPLPLRVIIGKRTRGFAFPDELREWLMRNTCDYRERNAYEHGARTGTRSKAS